MRLERMGCFHQTRLSFMRILLRRMKSEKWKFKYSNWNIQNDGYGSAVLTVAGPQRTYSLVAFSHHLEDGQRSDRVIATAWDMTFTLFDGVPNDADIARLKKNVPKQEAGRVTDSELSLSRANRSVRVWDHVVQRLAQGEQPDPTLIDKVSYLVRTTAVYGSGKFGAADRLAIANRPELSAPFQAELLSVWLIRTFSIDLAEHIARCKGGQKATTIHPGLRRRLGVGNSTGLGMAPFLVNHPILINNWMLARETAFARVRALNSATEAECAEFLQHLELVIERTNHWFSEHAYQKNKVSQLKADLHALSQHLENGALEVEYPWDSIYRWTKDRLSLEGQEQFLSLMLEPYGDLVDPLVDWLQADEHQYFYIDGSVKIGELKKIIQSHCAWAVDTNFEVEGNRGRFWYVSEEKMEPRLGDRSEIPDADKYEQPLCISYFIQKLNNDLARYEEQKTVSEFNLRHPEHRYAVRRVLNLPEFPYAEIQDNLISDSVLPIDLLRCKLSFFGATKFDPRSDRWVRICMYQDAPFPNELLEAAA